MRPAAAAGAVLLLSALEPVPCQERARGGGGRGEGQGVGWGLDMDGFRALGLVVCGLVVWAFAMATCIRICAWELEERACE